MNSYQKALIEEHSNLVVRTQNLHDYVYSDASNGDNRVEFANKCIQLTAMKKYEETLRARLENAGIVFESDNYFERVSFISNTVDVGDNTKQQNENKYCATKQQDCSK